ncbi:pyridoxamine 5'-phosphate oxidase family protein [Longibaculum muris]|nr:pyridoxamine 5'-phosphate oxidase family protein [Longibaculum muris]
MKTIWFSTNTSSNKVKYFKKNSKASVYFIDKRFFRGISLIGTMEVLETAEAKERIWQDGDTAYYKEGVTDPDYCVLKFTATKGRYYCNFKSEDFEV